MTTRWPFLARRRPSRREYQLMSVNMFFRTVRHLNALVCRAVQLRATLVQRRDRGRFGSRRVHARRAIPCTLCCIETRFFIEASRDYRRRRQRSGHVSRGSRSVRTTTSILSGAHWAGRERSQNHKYLDWWELRTQRLSRYPSADAKFLRVAVEEHPRSRLPEPPRHSRMRLTAFQSRPAIDAAICRPDGTLYQLQPSFHTLSTFRFIRA